MRDMLHTFSSIQGVLEVVGVVGLMCDYMDIKKVTLC